MAMWLSIEKRSHFQPGANREEGREYMPGPFFLPVGPSLLLSPICQTQSEARVQELYRPDILPDELRGAWGRVEVRLRSGMAWWRMSDPTTSLCLS